MRINSNSRDRAAPVVSDGRARALGTPVRAVAALASLSVLVAVFVVARRQPRATAAPTPATDTHGWNLVFSDDFSSDTLDGRRWTTCYWWDDRGCTNKGNAELQWYRPGNVRIADGVLELTARARAARAPDGTRYPYRSGMVTTGRDRDDTSIPARFAFQYGVVEVRARVPAGSGLWPALWLLPTTHESKPEIDILEVDGEAPDVGTAHLHYTAPDGRHRSDGARWRGADLSQGWHTFTLDWRPDRVTWYVDGRRRWSFTDAAHVPAEPMYLLANLAVGGDWVGDPGPDTTFPATFAIDHVRVWQRD